MDCDDYAEAGTFKLLGLPAVEVIVVATFATIAAVLFLIARSKLTTGGTLIAVPW